MYSINKYIHHLRFVVTDRDFVLYEYKPKLSLVLLVPFERLTIVRRIRLIIEIIRGGYYVYYLSYLGHITGYCIVTPGGRRLKISTSKDIVLGPYYIALEYRGKGYAKEMIRLTLKNCRYDYHYAYDWIDMKNIGSMNVTEACGFKECGRLNVVGVFRRLIETERGENVIYRYSRK